MTNGIILLATGHDNYHRMAENLAMSIRAKAGEDLPICLVSDRRSHCKYFTDFIDLPKDLADITPLRIKAQLNELTPYDKTLYLDVDMICTMEKNMADLLEIETDFLIQNLGKCLKSDWADVNDLKDAYGLKKLTAIFSECFVWTKGEQSDKIFKAWQKHFDDGIKVEYRKFNGGIPDELPLMIALAELEIELPRWIPIYWRGHGKDMLRFSMQLINERFYAYSIGGNGADQKMKEQYDILSRHFARVNDVKYPIYLHKAKKKWSALRVSC